MGAVKSTGVSGAVVVATLIVALAVFGIVAFGGGPSRSLVTPHPHVALIPGGAAPAS
jgi:hypothetical protein